MKWRLVNKNSQPAWYTENPQIVTIYNNSIYFKQFNDLINSIPKKNGLAIVNNTTSTQSAGGSTLNMVGRIFGGTALVVAVVAISPFTLLLDAAGNPGDKSMTSAIYKGVANAIKGK